MKKPRFSNLSIQIGLNLLTIFTVASLLFANRVVAAPAGQSAVPGIIPYQATLVDRQGNPVHGPIDIIFRLYAVPEGGTEMWVEEHIGPNAVSVIDGRFEVNLGSIEPLSTYIWNEPQLYLGVQIGSDPEMTPRPERRYTEKCVNLSRETWYPFQATKPREENHVSKKKSYIEQGRTSSIPT